VTSRGGVSSSDSVSSNRSRTSSKSHQSSKNPVICPICTEEVIDSGKNKKGHDSIFCDGTCQEWVHRHCAGLSMTSFKAVSSSSAPFLCPRCIIAQQSQEISVLKSSMAELSVEVDALKAQFASLVRHSDVTLPNSSSDDQQHSMVLTNSSETHGASPLYTLPAPPVHRPREERKYNVVLYGLPECPQGTRRAERVRQDCTNVVSTLSPLCTSFGSQSIKDLYRLGKYSVDRSRPILVKLNSSCDVSSVLSNRRLLADKPGVTVRPDLTISQRQSLGILLRERRVLISNGLRSRDIRILNNDLFIRNSLHGSVVDNHFVSSGNELSVPSVSESNVTATNPPSEVNQPAPSDLDSHHSVSASNPHTDSFQ
jgi:hypothetical protein